MALSLDRRALRRRELGYERPGIVTPRHFDQGMVETMGGVVRVAQELGARYFLDIPGVVPSARLPGIPIAFTMPEDVFERQYLPWVMIARDDVASSMQRWHPGTSLYRVPRTGAIQTVAGGRVGFDAYEERPHAEPVDITYTITCAATRRTGKANNGLELMWYYFRKVWKPYGFVKVVDSIGDVRTYDAFRESEYDATEVLGVSDRVASMGFTVRVIGELDIDDPVVYPAVQRRLTRGV